MKNLVFIVLALFLTMCSNDMVQEFSPMSNRSVSDTISVELIGKYDDASLIVEVLNNSSEKISIFRPDVPNRFLGKDLFDVRLGSKKYDYVGKLALVLDEPENWYHFEPNSSYSFSVDLSDGYDLSERGTYNVKYRSYAMIKRGSGEKEIYYISSHDLMLDIIEPVPIRFFSNPACKSTQKSKAIAGTNHAKPKTQNAINYLAKKGQDRYYTKWFGASNTTRFNKVKTGFNKIKSALNRGINHLCASSCDGFAAYVYKGRPYEINWCGNYVQRASVASIGETAVHEASHWNVVMSTDDYVYGKTKSMNLAKNSPEKAIDNADNVCFYPYDIPNVGTVDPPVNPPVDPPVDGGKNTLLAGKSMGRGQFLISGNKKYKFRFQKDGNLVIYSSSKVLWTSGTQNKGGVKLILKTNGNLALKKSNGQRVWRSNTAGKGIDKLRLRNDGKLVLYAGNKNVWAVPKSNTPDPEPPVDPPSNGEDWTYAVIGDTQFLSQSSDGLNKLKSMMRFIINKRNSLNIKFVASVGDMTQSGSNSSEWNRIKTAYKMLDDAGIPFIPCQGNHDSKTSIKNVFGYVKNKSHFGGMKDGIFNAYYLFSTGSDKIVVVVTEKEHSSNDRNWASGIFKKYSDRLGIVVNHDIGKGDSIYTGITRGNNNVIMGVMGHVCNEDRWTLKSSGGLSQTFARSDYQCRSNKGAFIRYYTFWSDKNKICAKTYNVTTNRYETDGDSQFCFTY